ncbi:AGAP003827-PB-like protein [Anopheles sinensis]|uniref:AGAP003827-PB-like protein n=1 Tax=Anopheles sinensis TaxID=74873 RepID=A0A084VGM7_ANOSI|nr:AGAP003827-PB-like protein [Anopheles sinensis]
MDHHLGIAPAANSSTPAHQHPSAGATSAASIPVGIAVARQRLQESSAGGAASPQLHQTKELNRFGIGLAAAAAAVAAANGGSINGTSSTPADLGRFFSSRIAGRSVGCSVNSTHFPRRNAK